VLPAAGALALHMRNQRPDGRVAPRVRVGLWDANSCRRTVLVARQVGKAARRHLGEVAAAPLCLGSCLAEVTDRHIHQARLDARQILVPQPDLGQLSRTPGLDQEVGSRNETQQDLAIILAAKIQSQASLVARIGGPKERPLEFITAPAVRSDPARRRATRRFDLDYISPEVCEDLPAEQPVLVSQIQDTIGREHETSRGFGFVRLRLCQAKTSSG